LRSPNLSPKESRISTGPSNDGVSIGDVIVTEAEALASKLVDTVGGDFFCKNIISL